MELRWIAREFPGRLAIALRPRGGDWLDDDLFRAARAGVTTLVSLLEPEEEQELGLADEARLAAGHGIRFRSFPTGDRGIPRSDSAAVVLVEQLRDELYDGRQVAVHCRMSIGRAGLVCAAVLVWDGVAPAEAWRLVEEARGLAVPDTAAQRDWVGRLGARRRRTRA